MHRCNSRRRVCLNYVLSELAASRWPAPRCSLVADGRTTGMASPASPCSTLSSAWRQEHLMPKPRAHACKACRVLCWRLKKHDVMTTCRRLVIARKKCCRRRLLRMSLAVTLSTGRTLAAGLSTASEFCPTWRGLDSGGRTQGGRKSDEKVISPSSVRWSDQARTVGFASILCSLAAGLSTQSV